MCWYKEGLYFKCQKCSGCCTGFSGYVWIDDKEIENISKFLKISIQLFLNNYTRQIFHRISLKELLPTYDCIFLKDKKCTIYEVRPKQCISYPFWEENLKSLSSWQALKKTCPGIDKEEFYSLEDIQKRLIP